MSEVPEYARALFNNVGHVSLESPISQIIFPFRRARPVCFTHPKNQAMNLGKLLVPLALIPIVASATETSIFSSDFSTGERVASGGTYDVGDWTLASTKNITGISYGASAFNFGMAATTSGFVETQNRFTATPVSISAVGEWIQLSVSFTTTATNNNLLAGGTSSSINIGLFDTGGNNPTPGLESSGLTSSNGSPFATGNAQTWEGYVGKIAPTGGANAIFTRPMQNTDTENSSENQDLLFNNVGNGAFDFPTGANLGTTATSDLAALANSTQFQVTMRIEVTAASEYTITYSLLNGAGDTTLQSISRTATGSTFIDNLSFDGFAIGYRQSGTSLATNLQLNSVNVTVNAIPEPASFAALAGVAGLALAGLRRRRRA